MYIVFDIETTGLDINYCEIIQFAYVMFNDDNEFIRAENLYFYKEGMHWSQEAADASHHMTLEFLRQYENDFRKNCIKMFTVLNESTVIGHNSDNFDVPFVSSWLMRQSLPEPLFNRQEDTMSFMRPLTKRPRVKLTVLTELCEINKDMILECGERWFGEEFSGCSAHNAMYDTTATALITLYAVKNDFINFGVKTITETLDAGEQVSSKVSIDSISKEWLDSNHVFYCEVMNNSNLKYIGTCDSPHLFSPPEYSSKESMPAAAIDRLLPITFTASNEGLVCNKGQYVISITSVSSVYTIQIRSDFFVLNSSECDVNSFKNCIVSLSGL